MPRRLGDTVLVELEVEMAKRWSRFRFSLRFTRCGRNDPGSLRHVPFRGTRGSSHARGIWWTVRLAWYQASPTFSPSMFQLQEMVGVMRMYEPGPTIPTRSTGGSAMP